MGVKKKLSIPSIDRSVYRAYTLIKIGMRKEIR
jgi:hypothetical protein